MNIPEIKSLIEIDKAIAQLQKNRETLLTKWPVYHRVRKNGWVIHNPSNTHYQFKDNFTKNVILTRNGVDSVVDKVFFNRYFSLATPEQVEKHLRYLNRNALNYVREGEEITPNPTPKINLPEFYMVTVEGKSGSIVRHETLEVAAAEATRLAKKSNHRAHIMGVVAIVEPVEVQKPVIEYKLIKK